MQKSNHLKPLALITISTDWKQAFLLIIIFIFIQIFIFNHISFIMGVWHEVVQPKTDSTFYRIFRVPSNADIWSVGILGFNPIFFM